MDSSSIPSVAIHSEIAAKLNFACHQSAFAFLRELPSGKAGKPIPARELRMPQPTIA